MVTGYVRGQPLSVNGLVHVPGWGDFQLLQIDAPEDPHPLLLGASRRNDVVLGKQSVILFIFLTIKQLIKCDKKKREVKYSIYY